MNALSTGLFSFPALLMLELVRIDSVEKVRRHGRLSEDKFEVDTNIDDPFYNTYYLWAMFPVSFDDFNYSFRSNSNLSDIYIFSSLVH